MVQRFISDMGPCRPTGFPSKTIIDPSNDGSNQTQCLSVTEGDSNAVSMHPLQALMDYCNIQACEIIYRLDSGNVLQVTRTHPEPREVHMEDLLTRRLSPPSVDAVEDVDDRDTAPESGQARGLPRAGRHSRTSKRKRRGGQRRPVKNRRAAIKSGYNSDSEDEIDELEGAETEMQQLRVADLLDYYKIAFRSISQLACKDIAKTWIRICHPKKQTSHPYNGGKTNVVRSEAEYGYLGHFTKPDYWPSDEGWFAYTGCRHREPDHVKKPERLILLVHLIRSQYKGFIDGDFRLEKMRQSTNGIHLECAKNWTTGYVERLNEIYRVREKEMQFERGEIDGDSLVPVEMPKPRPKVRKAPKSAVKAARPPNEQVKAEPKETSSSTFTAPIANMGINVQIEDMNLSEGSEPSILADTSSSTEEVAPDASCPEPIPCEARTIQHGLPFFESPSPTGQNHHSAQENWTPRSANLGHGATIFTEPNPFGSVATSGEAQRSLPLRDQYRFGSSSMQSFPGQGFPRCQYDHELTAFRRVANPMRRNGKYTRSPPARPVAPKVENIRHQTFAASSSGLVGAFPTGADYSRWQIDDLWNAQMEPSMYTTVADPSVSLLPPSNGSFSSGYSDASFSSGLQLDDWNVGNQVLTPPCHQGLDEELQQRFNLQAIGVPGYQLLGMNTPSSGNPDLANQFQYTTAFHTHSSLGAEHKSNPFSQDR